MWALLPGVRSCCMAKMEGKDRAGLGTRRGDKGEGSRRRRKPQGKAARGGAPTGAGETEMATVRGVTWEGKGRRAAHVAGRQDRRSQTTCSCALGCRHALSTQETEGTGGLPDAPTPHLAQQPAPSPPAEPLEQDQQITRGHLCPVCGLVFTTASTLPEWW